MSRPVRWIAAILLVAVGIAIAATAVFGGAFATIGCVESPPDWVYYLLLTAAGLTLTATVVPAVMLVRRSKARRIVLVLILGAVLSCLAYGAYAAALSSKC
jgi:bacteriorhodopsin